MMGAGELSAAAAAAQAMPPPAHGFESPAAAARAMATAAASQASAKILATENSNNSNEGEWKEGRDRAETERDEDGEVVMGDAEVEGQDDASQMSSAPGSPGSASFVLVPDAAAIASAQAAAQAIAISEENKANGETSLSDENFQQSQQPLPCPFQGRPVASTRALVVRLAPLVLPAILGDLGNWTAAIRTSGAAQLRALLVYNEEHSTAQLSQLLEALRLAALDDEAEIATLVVVSPRPRPPPPPPPLPHTTTTLMSLRST